VSDLFLVDTSVWIEVFRQPARLRLEDIVPLDEVVTCLPVVQEILQGFTDEAAYRKAKAALGSMPTVESPLSAEVFLEAAQLYRTCRRAGHTVRSSTDVLIAACALRNGLTVVHRDRDFDRIARVSGLEQREV
jgi:predicted nucleic acid-binding protein